MAAADNKRNQIQRIAGPGTISGADIRDLRKAGISDQRINNLIANRGAGDNASNVANQLGINIPGVSNRMAGDAVTNNMGPSPVKQIVGSGTISGADIRELRNAGISDQRIENLIENRGAGNNASNVAKQFGIDVPGGGAGGGGGGGGGGNTVTNIPTQSLDLQTLLSSLTREQDRADLLFASKLDKQNSEYFTTQSLRQVDALGAENRLTARVQGEEQRAGFAAQGAEQRLGIAATGAEERQTQTERFAGETGLIGARGLEERLGI